jgi:hypothetical protein
VPDLDTPLHDPARLARYLRIVAAQVHAEGDSAMHRQIVLARKQRTLEELEGLAAAPGGPSGAP